MKGWSSDALERVQDAVFALVQAAEAFAIGRTPPAVYQPAWDSPDKNRDFLRFGRGLRGGMVCAPPLMDGPLPCPQVKQMYRNDPRSRPDRVLFTALAVVLALVSAGFGAAMTYRPEPPPAVVANMVVYPNVQEMMLREHRCLSEALYYEARGEGVRGEKAVAEVVFHRMIAGNYGNSICAVVYEGSDRKVCQFSFTCNGDLDRPREAGAWNEAEQLAAQILTGEVRLANSTGGAINYHATSVKPYWAPTLERTARIGNHIFYRGTGRTRES